jgi:lipopolysaccharide export system protein LptC
MNGRIYDRIAAMMSVIFLVALGAGTYYLAAWANRDTSPAIQTKTNDPDVFVQGVSLTRTDASGEPIFQMSAASMQHFPFDGSSKFEQPRLISLDSAKPKVTLTADLAIASADGEQTELTGNVVLERQSGPEKPRLVIRTERITLLSENQVARTDARVQIEQGDARLMGTGMEFNNLSRDLSLSSQVQAVLPGSELRQKPEKVSMSR